MKRKYLLVTTVAANNRKLQYFIVAKTRCGYLVIVIWTGNLRNMIFRKHDARNLL